MEALMEPLVQKIKKGEFFMVNTGATLYLATKNETVRGWVECRSVYYDSARKLKFNTNTDALTVVDPEEDM
jgi:hypothetical protein